MRDAVFSLLLRGAIVKRRTRLQWYEYHLGRAQAHARRPVEDRFGYLIEKARKAVHTAEEQLAVVRAKEAWPSRIAGAFGFETAYWSRFVRPLEARLAEEQRQLSCLYEQQRSELQRADERGASDYRSAHAQRKIEANLRASRVEQRMQELRIRYLERSPSIRSAARILRKLLIERHSTADGYLTCHYCGARIQAKGVHMDHKRPVSRMGGNGMDNLALTCPSCNLKKGRRTHDEFVRDLNKNR